ncbi:hypothetical protein PIB30_036478 [Stylosanthes scabra]|uniref:Myb/SANT-like domain-containing protein n=1 Tax=Stylosanthes scabra TaxID=79078 RepID=A0ABU6XF90_9FABA|nr:hypothetical protein [Stylosanthes scabra]
MDKRMWSEEETDAFVGFMEEVVVDGTRPDCGQFRARTFEKLALKMIKRFPTRTLTAKHYKNKHKRMKEKYQYTTDMFACSGFGGMPRSSKDRATGSVAVSRFDAEEQIGEEPDEEDPTMDDYFMSSEPITTGPADIQGIAEQGTTSSEVVRKKRKQADILEKMADKVHESTAAQREHVQILANAISGKNEEVNMGEKLAELGFADHDAIQVVLKICSDPQLEKSFWGLTDAQKITIAQDVLDGKY